MRIRKNSRLVLGGSSSASPSSSSFLVCQLNRSPWDVDSFSPQGEWDDSFALNGSLGESLPASDSLPSGESMELSFEYVKKPAAAVAAAKREREGGAVVADEIAAVDEALTTQFCCQRLAKRGHSSCEHHFNKPFPVPPPKKAVAPPLPPSQPITKRRGRPRKVDAAVAGNPYEFYYYSGFGPRWGKRRGEDNNDVTATAATSSSSAYPKDDNGYEDDNNGVEASQIMSEDDSDIGYDNNNNNSNTNNHYKKKDVVIESVVDEELDYIDDDDDEEEELYGRRRVRKPIKARSLKSLM